MGWSVWQYKRSCDEILVYGFSVSKNIMLTLYEIWWNSVFVWFHNQMKTMGMDYSPESQSLCLLPSLSHSHGYTQCVIYSLPAPRILPMADHPLLTLQPLIHRLPHKDNFTDRPGRLLNMGEMAWQITYPVHCQCEFNSPDFKLRRSLALYSTTAVGFFTKRISAQHWTMRGRGVMSREILGLLDLV